MIKAFGFDPAKDPFTLSRGERQRVALASILATEPEILILDEPTTGLDYLECMQVMEAVRRLNRNGVTVVMVCHDMEVVLDFAERFGALLREAHCRRENGRNLPANRPDAGASLLPPQITQLALRLGEGFEGADTSTKWFWPSRKGGFWYE
jgi:energy-coupling factor transport system ATP-binding protein